VSSKSYDQYCGVAAGLDRVGDRWTLLVLRELSFGERRFTDLRAGLPGIATNLLADRLRSLEDDGLIEQRELPAPASRTVYALTDEGVRIRPVLSALSRFGLPYLPDPEEGRVRPQMVVYGTLGALFDETAARDVDLTVDFELDDVPLALTVRDGRLSRRRGEGVADLTVSGSAAALMEWCRGTAKPAALEPRLQIAGTRAARRSFAKVFALAA
jgi:DNA-binding HxlR family transcriptional regulator